MAPCRGGTTPLAYSVAACSLLMAAAWTGCAAPPASKAGVFEARREVITIPPRRDLNATLVRPVAPRDPLVLIVFATGDAGWLGASGAILEHMADYAQSPYTGIDYWQTVLSKMGRRTADQFARLYVAPGVDHVGTGAPANVDMLSVLAEWVERGRAPGDLEVVAQERVPPFSVTMSRPLCRWPAYPHYKGAGAQNRAASFECRPGKP